MQNNIFLPGGVQSDPLLNPQQFDQRIDELVQMRNALRQQEQKIQQIQQPQAATVPPENNSLFSDIEKEISTLTDEQKKELMNDNAYMSGEKEIQMLINAEIMSIVRPRVLSNPKVIDILKEQLNSVRGVKKRVAEENERVLCDFREYTQNYSHMKYDEFLNLKKGIKNDSNTSKIDVENVGE